MNSTDIALVALALMNLYSVRGLLEANARMAYLLATSGAGEDDDDCSLVGVISTN